MARTDPFPSGPHSLTHARLRAAQGDMRGARAILRAMLEVEPGHRGAAEALRELGQRRARAARLRRLLGRIERGRA